MNSLKVKKYIKLIIIGLERVLSRYLFDKVYEYLFPKYKMIIRVLYGAKYIFYIFTGDRGYAKMVKSIYQIMPYTLVGVGGLEVTYKIAKMMVDKNIEGNFIELGVARGGCAALMAGVAFNNNTTKRQLWLFDSFEGLPDPTEDDFGKNEASTGEHIRPLPKGSCLGTLQEVQKLLFNNFNYPKEKIFFVEGWFQNTLPVRGSKVGEIAVLRIDGDWYESTKYCLEYLYTQVVPGGAIIIDDYHSCFGCKKAVDEFINKHNIHVNMMFDGRGGCFFIKP